MLLGGRNCCWADGNVAGQAELQAGRQNRWQADRTCAGQTDLLAGRQDCWQADRTVDRQTELLLGRQNCCWADATAVGRTELLLGGQFGFFIIFCYEKQLSKTPFLDNSMFSENWIGQNCCLGVWGLWRLESGGLGSGGLGLCLVAGI